MKTTRNVLIIIAVVCVVAGIVIFAGAFAASGFKLHNMTGVEYEEKNYYVSEKFDKIDIKTVDADVSLIPIDNSDEARVECLSSERVTYRVEVENGVLRVERQDNTEWWEHIGFFINVPSFHVRVYLPVKYYEFLTVSTTSGEISIETGVAVGEVQLKTVSGDIMSSGSITESFEASTTSGELTLGNVTGARVSFHTTSGDAEISNVQAESIEMSSVSGDMDFTSVWTEEEFRIRTTSGDIDFNGCDGGDISVKTVSGDVEGSFWTDKSFDVHTTSGDVRVPQSVASAPFCVISTTSGDVNIKIRGH